MGQKVSSVRFPLRLQQGLALHWYAKKQFGEFLLEDLKLKRDLKSRFAGAGVSHVDIERAANRLKIIIFTSRPGIIIGRKGAEIDKLKSDLSAKTGREVLSRFKRFTNQNSTRNSKLKKLQRNWKSESPSVVPCERPSKSRCGSVPRVLKLK